MDEGRKKTEDILAELRMDYGYFPINVQEIRRMIEDKERGYSHEDIEGFYRDRALKYQSHIHGKAYEKLNILREDYGRCPLVKENTVLSWMETNDTDEEMIAKYRRLVARAENQERAMRINSEMRGDIDGVFSMHTIDNILDALERYPQESDAQIIHYVNQAIWNWDT